MKFLVALTLLAVGCSMAQANNPCAAGAPKEATKDMINFVNNNQNTECDSNFKNNDEKIANYKKQVENFCSASGCSVNEFYSEDKTLEAFAALQNTDLPQKEKAVLFMTLHASTICSLINIATIIKLDNLDIVLGGLLNSLTLCLRSLNLRGRLDIVKLDALLQEIGNILSALKEGISLDILKGRVDNLLGAVQNILGPILISVFALLKSILGGDLLGTLGLGGLRVWN